MSAEELKEAVRKYMEVAHPGWQWATVVIQTEPGKPAETLVVRPVNSI